MLGRKTYTPEELDNATTAIDRQLAAYKKLVKVIDTSDPKVAAALADFEPLVFNNQTLALDRPFVHRLRVVTGKDGNPLNEVELLVESLLNNGGVLRTGTVVKYVPEQTVLGLQPGDRIAPSVEDFARLADAFLTELEKRFVG
jgi:hypothetical protein